MAKIKRMSVRYNETDVPFVKKEDGAYLTFNINNKNQIEIVGNSTGLKLLSKALLGMSGTERSDGFHIHVDDLYSINNENKSFIVSRVDDKK